jgi:hypothetical protein
MPEEFRVFHESYYDAVVSVLLPDDIDPEKISEVQEQARDLAATTLTAAGINIEESHREYGFSTDTVEAINSPFQQEHLLFNNIRRAVKTVRDFRAKRQTVNGRR